MQRVRDVKSYDPSLWQLWFHGVHSSKGAVITSLQPPSKFDQAWKYCLRSDISRPQQTKNMEFRVFMNLRSFNTWGCTVVSQEKSYGSESEAAGTSTCRYWVKMHPTVKLLRLIHQKHRNFVRMGQMILNHRETLPQSNSLTFFQVGQNSATSPLYPAFGWYPDHEPPTHQPHPASPRMPPKYLVVTSPAWLKHQGFHKQCPGR